MNESEFRDYIRTILRQLDERVTRLERAPAPEALGRPSASLKGSMTDIAEHLLAEARAGRVSGLAIAYLGEQPMTACECVEGERTRLLGAAMLMVEELLAPSRAPPVETKREDAA
jgi:hypothetical protein